MFKATREIEAYLKTMDGLKVHTQEDEESSTVWLSFGIKNGGSYRINLISRSEKNDVAVRVYGLIKTSEEKRDTVRALVNELNNKYRFVKFICDKDGDVNLEYDFPLECENVGKIAFEMLVRFSRAVEEAYPQLMHALWS